MNYTYSMEKTKKQKVLGSLLFGVFYASTDELHQYFVPGRSARLFDVGIDTLGVLTGILAYLVIRKLIKNIDIQVRIHGKEEKWKELMIYWEKNSLR